MRIELSSQLHNTGDAPEFVALWLWPGVPFAPGGMPSRRPRAQSQTSKLGSRLVRVVIKTQVHIVVSHAPLDGAPSRSLVQGVPAGPGAVRRHNCSAIRGPRQELEPERRHCKQADKQLDFRLLDNATGSCIHRRPPRPWIRTRTRGRTPRTGPATRSAVCSVLRTGRGLVDHRIRKPAAQRGV